MKCNENVKILREWISKQPHLPQKNNENLLRRFLYCSNDSIELAKKLIDLFYTLRSQIPEVFTNRDPTSQEVQEVLENIQFIPLPTLTKENYQVFVYRLLTSDLEKFDFNSAAKVFTIFSDVRLAEENKISDGEVPIYDMKNFTIKHLTKLTFPVMKKVAVYLQEAHPIRLKQVHYVNAPPFFETFLNLIKPIIKSEVLKMIHFHPPNSESLFEYIPKDLLPEEYGGTLGKCDDLNTKWCDIVMKWKEYLIDDEFWTVDETKRVGDNDYKSSQHLGIQGSFKTLNID